MCNGTVTTRVSLYMAEFACFYGEMSKKRLFATLRQTIFLKMLLNRGTEKNTLEICNACICLKQHENGEPILNNF